MSDAPMTVIDMLKAYLADNSYDGLSGDDCGCVVDDMPLCEDGPNAACVAGYRHDCGDDCDFDSLGCGLHMLPGKRPEPDAHGNRPNTIPMPCSVCGKITQGVSGKVTKCAMCPGCRGE